MAEAIVKVRTVMINTLDPKKLAPFWAELLGVEIATSHDEDFLWLKRQEGSSVGIAFQKVSEPTPGRRRLHLDTQVADLEAAASRIIEIGGSHLESHQIGDFKWQVMADPDGNEFCIATE